MNLFINNCQKFSVLLIIYGFPIMINIVKFKLNRITFYEFIMQ